MADDLRPVLLLDFDDVLCINRPYGGFDAKLALAQLVDVPVDGAAPPSDLWIKLFDVDSKALLAKLDREFRPRYVLTTNWWWHFTYEEVVEVLVRTELDFVRDNLHSDWATPKGCRPASRRNELANWIEANPHDERQWVVLGNELSGTGLGGVAESEADFIVLCRKEVGLTIAEYVKVRARLTRRLSQA